MKRIVLSILLVLSLAAPVTLAQEVEATEAPELILDQPLDEPVVDVPEETAPVFTPPAPGDVANGALLALLSLFATAIASPLTAPIVSVLKRVPFLQQFNGDQLNLGVAMILSVVAWGAASLGFAGQIDSVYRLIFAVLPILTGAGGNFIANQSVYKFGVKRSIPVLGYSRTGVVG